ncbi:MAG TPA: outer membrane protein OmpK [Lysobacter sp.]|nr:outer membrane protein OmpK [Lysobacter sp.]
MLRIPLSRAALAGALLLVAAPAASDPLQWQNNSASYLYGRDFTVGPDVQQTLTLEHASGWSVGDLFAFVDLTAFNGEEDAATGASSWYGEIAPRLSFGKLAGKPLAAGPVRDVLLAGAVEFGEGPVETALLGVGVDLAVPGFDYVQVNAYRRQSLHSGDVRSWQLTPAWRATLPLGRSDLVIDGYIDWIPVNRGGRHANLHVSPQIKYDLGKALGGPAQRVYAGIEYDYWSDKYGIDDDGPLGRDVLGGTDQNTFSLLLKVHLP